MIAHTLEITIQTHMIEINARNRFLDVKIMMINEKPIEMRVP